MNPLVQAFQIIIQFLEKEKIDYMVIGGIANSIYGNPRQTFDIDIKIDLDQTKLNEFISQLNKIGNLVPEDPINFMNQHHVLPMDINSVRIDLVICHLAFEKAAIKRSVRKKLFAIEANVSSIEDLIIQKSISTREKDWFDIRELIQLQHVHIDWDYLLKHVAELSDFLSDPTIMKRIRTFKNEN
jgi:hypothetical protein